MIDKKYSDINKNKEHVITFIKWLIDEVKSSGGDGDGIWYSRYYSTSDIKELIIDNGLLPDHWMIEVGDEYISMGENQEWLIITNSEKNYNNQPDWAQIVIKW